MAAALPAPAPERTPEGDVFWSATAEGHLVLARCDACGVIIWYPRAMCPDCGTTSVSWVEASGFGTVYSFTIVHRGGAGPYRDVVPYVIAYVELLEGPRVLTNIVDCEPELVRIGQPVQVVFSDTGEGSALYRFRPAASHDG
jgi:uncharacterized OB-fold protein